MLSQRDEGGSGIVTVSSGLLESPVDPQDPLITQLRALRESTALSLPVVESDWGQYLLDSTVSKSTDELNTLLAACLGEYQEDLRKQSEAVVLEQQRLHQRLDGISHLSELLVRSLQHKVKNMKQLGQQLRYLSQLPTDVENIGQQVADLERRCRRLEGLLGDPYNSEEMDWPG